MHPLDELFTPTFWQLELIERLHSTSNIQHYKEPKTYEEANDLITYLNENQQCPVKEIGKFSLKDYKNFMKKHF